MDIQTCKTSSVADIVYHNPGAVKVFESFNIDYCCNGKMTFEEACQKAHANEEEVLSQLQKSISDTHVGAVRAQDWPLDLLAQYIIQNHHQYVRKVVPEILFLTDKVSFVHGDQHPELYEIEEQFELLSEELEKHMHKEEVLLFPAIIDLVRRSNSPLHELRRKDPIGFKLEYPIEVMEKEHDTAGQCLTNIRQLSKHYTLPPTACNSYTLLYKRLKEFEEDLHTHIHLENNILFPKALKLEERMENRYAMN